MWPFSRKVELEITKSDQWYVQLDGIPVALICNPIDADMFWFEWDLQPFADGTIPADLWDYSMDARRSFRHVVTNELDPGVFPAGSGRFADGKVLLRGPLRNRGRLLDSQEPPKSRVKRFLDWFVGHPQ